MTSKAKTIQTKGRIESEIIEELKSSLDNLHPEMLITMKDGKSVCRRRCYDGVRISVWPELGRIGKRLKLENDGVIIVSEVQKKVDAFRSAVEELIKQRELLENSREAKKQKLNERRVVAERKDINKLSSEAGVYDIKCNENHWLVNAKCETEEELVQVLELLKDIRSKRTK